MMAAVAQRSRKLPGARGGPSAYRLSARRAPFAVFLVAIWANTCWAGGTVGQREVLELLSQKPALKEFIVQGFDLPDSAWADIRLGSHFEHLGGTRLGPYTLDIRVRNMPDSPRLKLTVCTKAQFLDDAGRFISEDAPELFGAAAVRETLVKVNFTPASDPAAAGTAACQ